MAVPTLFAVVASPVDNGSQGGSTNTVTPPASMQSGDLVQCFMLSRDTDFQGSFRVPITGGQNWQQYLNSNRAGITDVSWGHFACRYNGSWTADPQFDNGGSGNAVTVIMLVWRPTSGKVADFCSAPTEELFDGTAGAKTHSGLVVDSESIAVAAWFSPDANTWGSLTGGWSQSGLSAQYRNTTGLDSSIAIAYKTVSPGATGSVSMTQATLGGDAGAVFMSAIFEHDPPVALGAVDFWETFDFTTIDTTNLDANDHITGGSWSVSNAGGKLTTSTQSEKITRGTINGLADTGTRGLEYDPSSTGVAGFVQYNLASAVDQLASMNWLRTIDLRGSFTEHDVISLGGVVADAVYLKMTDDRFKTGCGLHLFTAGASIYTPAVSVPPSTWVWAAIYCNRNAPATYTMRVFDDTGNQIGFQVQTGQVDEPVSNGTYGSLIGSDATATGSFYLDDWLMDWTNHIWPAVPMNAPTMGYLRPNKLRPRIFAPGQAR